MKSKMCRFISDVCSGSRVGCGVCANAGGTPAATVKKSATADYELGKKGRGVREKAPLQDQLSKGMRAGRPCVQQQRCECIAEMCDQPVILEAKIDIGKNAVTSRPTLGDSWSNRTQNFAALHLRRLFLLLFRLGMKWAGGLRRIAFRRHRCERAMIRDRDPRKNCNRNARATHTRFHIQCRLWSARTRPRFKSGDMSPHSK